VIQEVIQSDAGALGDNFVTEWTGIEGKKGLLVAAKRDYGFNVVAKSDANHLVDVEISTPSFNYYVTAIWSVPPKARDYTKTVCEGLDQLQRPTNIDRMHLVLGDFNASKVFDPNDTKANQFGNILERTESRGLKSLWHNAKGEEFGLETHPTFFMHYNEKKPFHIDFIFGCLDLSRFRSDLEFQLSCLSFECQGAFPSKC
jgi:hypothetical protein